MFEAYSVAIRISLINGVTSGLMNISRAFAKTHGDAEKLKRQLDAIKFKLLAGGVLAGTGLFGLSLIEKTVPAAREYAHQIQQMNVAGMRQVEIAQSVAEAWKAAGAAPTATAAENLKAIRELRMVFGDTQHAIANVVTVQKLQAVLQNAEASGHKLGMGDQAYTVAKALEMRGATRTPGEFTAQSDMMTKAIIASGGKVTPQDFLNNIIYGRRAAYGWDNAFTYTILPTLIQEMKGGGSGGARGPGNALMSAYAAVVGGTIPQKALKVWSELGLIDRSKVVWTKAGEMKGVKPGGISGSEVFQANPYQWAQQVLLPAMQRRGLNSPEQMRQTLQYLFPNRTASIMDQMVMQAWKFQRDQRLIQGAQGLGAYNQLVKNDPFMAQQALEAQWTNVKTRLGLAVLPMLITGTVKLTAVLTALSNWMGAHQGMTKGLVLGFTALSAAMAFGGTVMLLSAAFDGLALAASVLAIPLGTVAAGLVALMAPIIVAAAPILLCVGALAALGIALYEGFKHIDVIKGALTSFWNWLSSLFTGAIDLLTGRSGSNHVTHQDVQGAPYNVQAARQGHAVTHRDAAPGAASPRGRSPYVAPVSPQKSSFTGDVHMDGQKVGQVVWRHQADAMDRASLASTGGYDPGMTLAPTGLGYA